MPLDSYLVSKLGASDILSSRALIRDGFVELNKQIVKQQDFPVSTQDSVKITDSQLVGKPRGYFQVRELQKECELFTSTTDALCIGADPGTLLFLKDTGASVANAGAGVSDIPGVLDISLNPLMDCISKKHSEKFNFIIFGPKFGLFTAFSILENNKESLLSNGRALLDVREKDSLSEEHVTKLCAGAGFLIDRIFISDLDPSNGWIVLAKKKE